MISINLVEIQDIRIIQKKVTEEISEKYINSFISTVLQEYDISKKIYEFSYIFFKQQQLYYIFTVKKTKETNILVPQIFTILYDTKELELQNSNLFVVENFFVLYINGKMQFFKSIDNQSTNADIEEYINKIIHIKIDNIFNISNNQLEDIKEKYINNFNKIKLLEKSNSKKRYKYFFISISILSLFSFYFLYLEKNKVKTDEVLTLLSEKSKVLTKPIVKKEKKAVIKKIKLEIKVPKLNPKAIVDNSILVNNNWLSVGEDYKGFKISKISLEYIELRKDKKIFRIDNDNR
jgi:hypothetical protein